MQLHISLQPTGLLHVLGFMPLPCNMRLRSMERTQMMNLKIHLLEKGSHHQTQTWIISHCTLNRMQANGEYIGEPHLSGTKLWVVRCNAPCARGTKRLNYPSQTCTNNLVAASQPQHAAKAKHKKLKRKLFRHKEQVQVGHDAAEADDSSLDEQIWIEDK